MYVDTSIQKGCDHLETLQSFLNDFNDEMQGLYKTTAEIAWMAQTTGDPEWAAKLGEAETKYNLLFASKETYEKVKHFLATENGTEIEKRQLHLLRNEMEGNQLPEEVIADLSKRASELNLLFNTYTPEVDGKKYSANAIREVLINSNDQELRKKVWFASKEVGKVRHIETKISPEFFTKETGEMLINEFFKLGALYNWNEKISHVTGEKLNPAHFSNVYYKTHEKI